MIAYGYIESVNLSTGERFRRVSGNGESRLVCESVSRPKTWKCLCKASNPDVLKYCTKCGRQRWTWQGGTS